MVKNLKLILSLGQFNVQKGKHIAVVTITVSVIEGRPKDVFRYVIIILLLLFFTCHR